MDFKKNLIVSPYCKTIGPKPHPKNYPYFPEVINGIKDKFHICQIGIEGEEVLPGINELCQGLPIGFLITKLQKEADLVITVDNMINHLCWSYKIPCIVIFSKSDPEIFGHEENINLLKDRKYLSHNQFDMWQFQSYDINAFIEPEKVMEVVMQEHTQQH